MRIPRRSATIPAAISTPGTVLASGSKRGTGAFNNIGSVTAGNSADAGPISFSQDGQTLLLSNGAGGDLTADLQRLFWTMPAAGGAAAQVAGGGVPYTGDAVALPAASTIPGSGTKYIVYEGNSSYGGSSRVDFRCLDRNGPGRHRQWPRGNDFDRHQSEEQ